jgi:LysR family hydrogen peroxide-inducible transcriptional activator
MKSMVHLPSLRQLGHLVALADSGHFGRGAASCHVTQSTLSASVMALERLLGASLVDRTSRKVVFTPLGREVVARARDLLRDAENLALVAKAGAEPLVGLLKLGAIPTIGPFLLPRVLPQLRRRFPKLKLYLREDLTARLLEMLERGDLDVALIALPYDTPNIETEVLFEDPFVVTLRKDDALAQHRQVRSSDLAREPLLLLAEGHCMRGHALSACRQPRSAETQALEATSLLTLVQMVENGLGATLLPQLAVDGGILRGTKLVTRSLAASAEKRAVGLAWRKGTRRAQEFKLLGGAIAEAARQR